MFIALKFWWGGGVGTMWKYFLSYAPHYLKVHFLCLKVPRLCSLAILIRTALKWRWIWGIGGTCPTAPAFTWNGIITVGRAWEAIPIIHGTYFCGFNMVIVIHSVCLSVCVSHHQLNTYWALHQPEYWTKRKVPFWLPHYTIPLCRTGVLDFVLPSSRVKSTRTLDPWGWDWYVVPKRR